jgi:HEAT repeat protein
MIRYFCPSCWAEVSKTEKICPYCKESIEKWDEKSFVGKLISSLTHSERSIVYRACYILGERREKTAVELLIHLLNSTNDHFLKEEIVEALGKIGDERALPVLINELLNNPSFLVRGKAATALENFKGSKEVIEALKRAMGDCSRYVKESALKSLDKLRSR